jgi:RNA-directed DNA polymerase
VLHLIKMWLDCPVEETDKRGRKTRTTEATDHRRGPKYPEKSSSDNNS